MAERGTLFNRATATRRRQDSMIEVKGLTKRYRDLVAVDTNSFDLPLVSHQVQRPRLIAACRRE